MRSHRRETIRIHPLWKKSFQTNLLSITTWKPTRSELPNVHLLAQPAEKHSTTTPLTPRMSTPLINNKPPTINTNDTPSAKKSKRTDQTAASTASELSATPHSAPQASDATAGSSWEADPILIPSNLVSSSDKHIAQTYRQHWSQIRTRFSRRNRCQDWYNSTSQPSTPTASANNWARSSLINPPSSKSTCRLVSFCKTQKPEPYNTITRLPTIIWC